MRSEHPSLPTIHASSTLPLPNSHSLPTNFTLVAVSSAEMMMRLPADLLKKVKPCLYHPASHTLRLLVAG